MDIGRDLFLHVDSVVSDTIQKHMVAYFEVLVVIGLVIFLN